MVIQVPKNLAKEKIDEYGHGIADAFFDYEYTEGEIGMKGFIRTREAMYTFMRAVFDAAVKSGCAYMTEGAEGFLILTDSDNNSITFINSIREMIAETEAVGGFLKMLEFSRISSMDGGTLSQKIFERQAPYIYIEILAVRPEYQHQGHMRELMEFVYERAKKTGYMVALDTDDKSKADRYAHLGMILYRVRDCGPGYHIYDMIR